MKARNMKELNWKRYHITRDTLLMAIQNHLQSIGKVNVYNNVTNTSGDHSLMNESMGTVEMKKLTERLTKWQIK